MLAKVAYSRKIGMANYSSAGASCEIAWETDARDEPLSEQIAAAYRMAEDAVREQLQRAVGDQQADPWADAAEPEAATPPPAPARLPAPRPAAARPAAPVRPAGRADRAEKPRSLQPQRKTPAPMGDDWPDRPRTARQVYAWAAKIEEAGYPGAVKLLSKYGRETGLGWRTSDWPDEAAPGAADYVIAALSAR